MRKPQPSRPKVRDAFSAIHADQIRAFERELGTPLPDDYVRFLLSTNGGHFHDARVPFIGDAVRNVYALDCGFDWADLRWTRDACSHWIPQWLLPIANGAGGNEYCLSLGSASRGEIYHVMAEWPFAAPDDPPEMTKVAPSFEEFLRCVELDESQIRSERDEDDAIYAAEIGDLEWLKQAAQSDPSILSRTASDGDTMLHRAVYRCQLEVAEWLIRRGHDIDARDAQGNSPLFMAAYAQSVDAVRLLVAHGCNLTARNNDGNVALIVAAEWKYIRSAIELWQAMSRASQAEPYRSAVRELCEDDEDLMTHLVPVMDQA